MYICNNFVRTVIKLVLFCSIEFVSLVAGSPERGHLCGRHCPKVYRPVCASTGAANITFTNDCELQVR